MPTRELSAVRGVDAVVMPVFLLVFLLALAAPAATAVAAPVDELPQLGGAVLEASCSSPPAAPRAVPLARGAGGPSVRTVLRRAAQGGRLSAEDAERFEDVYADALAARRRLGGLRRVELGSVVATLESLARRRLLTVSRMPVLFLQLEVNTSWWSKNGPPPAPPAPPKPKDRPCAGGTGQGGARIVRRDTVFQWYGGQGLQIQQLATAGRANALVKACLQPELRRPCDRDAVRSAMDRLAMLAVDRGGFRAWEYYFAFGGGRAPWISGLAQGTAMQALARGTQLLGERRYVDVARRAAGAFRRRHPVGVRAPAPGGAHYLIYSFNPRLRVLNGFLQSLVGLHDYAEIAGDARARRLFADGERRARREVPLADTGAWSRYSAGGAESDLGYHRLVRDFLESLCDRTRRGVYCSTAKRFTRYLHERAGLDFLPAPRPRARRTVATRVFLTKISCVTLRVTRDGAPVATLSRVLGRGAQTLAWVPPRPGAYAVEVEARDLMNHRTRIRTTVKAAR